MELDRWKLFERLGYARIIESMDYGTRAYPVAEVRAFHNSDARIKITTAPARSGKSWSAAYDVCPDILMPLFTGDSSRERRHLICGPEYEHASKEFNYIAQALVHNRDRLGIEGPTRFIFQPKLGRLEIYWKEWNTWVIGRSAKQIQSLLGDQWVTVILSETAQLDERVWRQGLSTRYGRTIWPTTPSVKGRWIKEFYENAVARDDRNVHHFRLPPWANPYYDKRTFDEALARYGDSDPYFREQFLGDWDVWYGGRVFPTFQPDPIEDVSLHVTNRGIEGGDGSHCVMPFHIPGDWIRFAGIDFGWQDPTVFLWMALSPIGEVVVYDEYIASQRSMGDHIQAIKEKSRLNGTEWPIRIYREPRGQAKQIAEDMARDHQVFSIAIKGDRLAGRLRVAEFLTRNDQGMPTLRVVRDNCPGLVRSLTELHYDDVNANTTREGREERWIGYDHPVDALKYALLARVAPRFRTPKENHRAMTLDNLMRRHRKQLKQRGLIGHDRDGNGRIVHYG